MGKVVCTSSAHRDAECSRHTSLLTCQNAKGYGCLPLSVRGSDNLAYDFTGLTRCHAEIGSDFFCEV